MSRSSCSASRSGVTWPCCSPPPAPISCERLVLADGGIPAPVPPGVDTDALLQAVVGPAIDRLGQVFPSPDAYLDFWRSHPALSEEWNRDVEVYLEYDLEQVEGGYVSRARQEPVRTDGAGVLTDSTAIAEALRSVRCPISFVRAPRNLVNEPTPLYADAVVEQWAPLLGQFSDEMVGGTNHYTLMFGERGASTLAEYVLGTRAGAMDDHHIGEMRS